MEIFPFKTSVPLFLCKLSSLKHKYVFSPLAGLLKRLLKSYFHLFKTVSSFEMPLVGTISIGMTDLHE
jgi:hypothetical protein